MTDQVPTPTPAQQPAAAPTSSAAPGYAPAAPTAPWNVLAIVSLVTSLIGFGIVGIITGHISLGQIKRTGEQGHGIALAGTIIGYVAVALGIIAGIIAIIWAIAFAGYASTYNY